MKFFDKRVAVFVRTPQGQQVSVQGVPGQSLMRAISRDGVDGLLAECGGRLVCATCHVLVDPEWAGRLPPPSGDEDAMLDLTASPRRYNSRLSCQIVLESSLDGLVIHLPDRQI